MVQKEWVEHHERHCTWHPAGVCRMRAADVPVLLPVACAESLRQRLAGAWTMAASRGRVLSRPMPMADIIVLMTLLLLSLSATGCWIAGGDSQTALAAMVFVATVTAVCACCAVVLLSFVGSAGRRPLPASFRFDATVMNAVRSWARPQWMPRWPRYTLPDSRI